MGIRLINYRRLYFNFVDYSERWWKRQIQSKFINKNNNNNNYYYYNNNNYYYFYYFIIIFAPAGTKPQAKY